MTKITTRTAFFDGLDLMDASPSATRQGTSSTLIDETPPTAVWPDAVLNAGTGAGLRKGASNSRGMPHDMRVRLIHR